jgi:hypothetical protein
VRVRILLVLVYFVATCGERPCDGLWPSWEFIVLELIMNQNKLESPICERGRHFPLCRIKWLPTVALWQRMCLWKQGSPHERELAEDYIAYLTLFTSSWAYQQIADWSVGRSINGVKHWLTELTSCKRRDSSPEFPKLFHFNELFWRGSSGPSVIALTSPWCVPNSMCVIIDLVFSSKPGKLHSSTRHWIQCWLLVFTLII